MIQECEELVTTKMCDHNEIVARDYYDNEPVKHST